MMTVERNYTASLLATMLKGMKPQSREGCCIGMIEDPEHTAFFMQCVTVKFAVEKA